MSTSPERFVAASLVGALAFAGVTTAGLVEQRETAAKVGSSQPLGALPPGARVVEAFAFDPRNPDIVYLLMGGLGPGPGVHVYKTTDSGAHWQPTATSGSGWLGYKAALAADPRHPGTLYAGTEVAVNKTTDGGRTWRPSKRGLLTPPRPTYVFNRDKGWVVSLAVDPANTNIVYAGSDRVSKSTDGGHRWKTVFPPHPTSYPRENVTALAIAPGRPEAIYALAGDFADPSATPAVGRTSILKSTDGGATWQTTTAVRGRVAPTALAVDPRDPSTVYAAVSRKILRTTDAGKTWQTIAGDRPDETACSCLSEGGVTTLSVDPRHTGTVYAALTQGGIYKTDDGGKTWIRSTADDLLDDYRVAVDPERPTTIYATAMSATGNGPWILRSLDSGRTWTSAH
jgi:photosystem II stability/assembly factor-like uncharacterized protein